MNGIRWKGGSEDAIEWIELIWMIVDSRGNWSDWLKSTHFLLALKWKE